MIKQACLLLPAFMLAGACVPRSELPAPATVASPPQAQPDAVRAARPALDQPRPTQPARLASPAPRPAPTQPPPSASPAWLDAPLTPGLWTYRATAPGSSASFGVGADSAFLIRCIARGQIILSRGGAATAGSVTFRTSALARTLVAAMQQGAFTATIPAGDPLLDALAFSRGRFAVDAPGSPQLVIPAWPELARVVEDCRR